MAGPLVKLTRNGRPVYVNVTRVAYLEQSGDGTKIVFRPGNLDHARDIERLEVSEPIEKAAALLNGESGEEAEVFVDV
jgi:hypothetical protein